MEMTISPLMMSDHGPSCDCCRQFISGESVVVRKVVVGKRDITSPYMRNNPAMGGWFEDVTGISIATRMIDTMTEIVNGIIRAMSDIVAGILKALEGIDWEKVTENLGKAIGEATIWLNPSHLVNVAFKSFPLTNHLYKEMDKITGGAVSTMDNIATVTGRALKGDAITKQEIVQNALFLIRVAAVMMAGPVGSSLFNAALVAQVAGQMKQGTLGKTTIGRLLLGAAEVAGYAYMVKEATVGSAVEKYSVTQAKDTGQNYVMTNTQLGRGEMGPYVAGLAFAAGEGAYWGEDSYDTLTKFSESYARSEAVTVTAERVGGPYAKEIAEATVDAVADGKFDPSKIDFSNIPDGYSYNQFVKDLQNAYGDVKDGLANFMNQSGGQASFPRIDFTGAGDAIYAFGVNAANEISKVPGNIVTEISRLPDNLVALAESVDYPSLSSPNFPGLAVPDIKSPRFDMDGKIDWQTVFDAVSFLGKHALYRKQGVRGKDGKRYTVYVLEDGSLYYVLEGNSTMLWLAAAAAAATIAIS